ncbi:MAG: fumarylacetoacetate hydrolase family protein [Proteobacteria bacterium]|nr:fumarylacetoacetate hydrolase family protein [Pseudomonadota bacterium]
MTQAEDFAKAIAERHRNRERFNLDMPPGREGDVAFGYATQAALLPMLGGAIVGWKIGLTTKRMQLMCGIDEPIVGAVLSGRILEAPAQAAVADYVRLGLESEIALRIATPFPDHEVTPTEALSHVDLACAAFELVDDSAADYARLSAAALVADNAWNAGLVLGPAQPAAGLASLAGRRGVLVRNGEKADEGSSSDVLGDPAAALAWVARHLAARGQPLEPGQWVSTGSIVPTKFVSAGQTWRFEVEGLAPVELSLK